MWILWLIWWTTDLSLQVMVRVVMMIKHNMKINWWLTLQSHIILVIVNTWEKMEMMPQQFQNMLEQLKHESMDQTFRWTKLPIMVAVCVNFGGICSGSQIQFKSKIITEVQIYQSRCLPRFKCNSITPNVLIYEDCKIWNVHKCQILCFHTPTYLFS